MSAEEKFFKILNGTKEPAYDVETNGLDWKRCHTIGYSISDGTEAAYVPVRHSGGGNIDQPEHFEQHLSKSIKEHKGKIIGHNVKFDMHFSENHGIKFGDQVADTMVYEALLNENRRSYSLENVAKQYNVTPKHGKTLYEYIAKQFDVPGTRDAMGHYHRLAGDDPIAVEYAAGDTITTKQLYDIQKKEIYAQQLDVVAGLEDRLCYVLQKMERRGVMVDPEQAELIKQEVDELYFEAYAKIPIHENEYGDLMPINVRSGKDLKEYFELCEIDDWPMTAPTERFPQGQPSFNKEYLSGFQEGLNILNVRKLAHLKSSFLDVLDKHIYEGKIHTTFNQTRGETHGTRSGRLSSSYPNMQQVPKRDKQLGKIYRRIFVPKPDYIFIEFDYSQAEPRLYSHYSREPSLIDGYNAKPFVDMHAIAAEYMGLNDRYGRTKDGLKKARDVAKNLNLGMMYTMGAMKLSIQLGITYNDALAILKKWHKTFPQVSQFTKKAAKVAEDRGYVKTILGRRSRFDDPRYSYRAANRIVQGGSADILKYKLAQIDSYLVAHNLEEVCEVILTIHDSVAFMIHKDYTHLIETITNMLERVDTPPFNLTVPFVAEYSYGSNWAEATYGVEQPLKEAA